MTFLRISTVFLMMSVAVFFACSEQEAPVGEIEQEEGVQDGTALGEEEERQPGAYYGDEESGQRSEENLNQQEAPTGGMMDQQRNGGMMDQERNGGMMDQSQDGMGTQQERE